MKKTLISISLLVCLLLSLAVPVSAQANYVVDMAGLLADDEIRVLEEMCADIAAEDGIELVFLTVDSLEGKSSQSYADDFYDYGPYGENGIVFLIAMDEREWYVSTCGTAIDALSDDDLTELQSIFLSFLSENEFYSAFFFFADEAPRYFGEGKEIRINFFLSITVGAILAGIILLVMRSTMNTKNAQRCAGTYQIKDSFHMKQTQDLYLYSNVSKVRRQENNTNRSGGGTGGSSVHRSSSGRSHGGRGGKF